MPAPITSARLPIFVAGLAASALGLVACTFNPGQNGIGLTNSGSAGSTGSGAGGNAGGGIFITGMGGSNSTGAGGAGSPFHPGTINQVAIPAGYTMTDVGAYMTGAPIPANGGMTMIDSPQTGCYQVVGVVRDFRDYKNWPGVGSPDFEHFSGGAQTPGLVATDLGADRKPVYASMCEDGTVTGTTAACPYGPQTTSKANFDQWYRTMDGVNMAYDISFIFEPVGNGMTAEFNAATFFPLDGLGFGNTPGTMPSHNFSFTTELHTKFFYNGGETFTFTGDDDLWVFINGKLAIDLGGLHPQTSMTLDMDAQAAMLGITKGNAYNIELFHAERHTTESHFRVDTNFVFVDCGTIIP
jgi:fibro-slime domain-containing protein